MSVEELERKPHSEWSEDEIKFWLSGFAKEEMLKELYYGS